MPMSQSARWRLVALLGVGATLVASSVAPKSLLGQQLSYFLVVFVLIIPVHELGHAIAGAAVGYRVVRIVVGTGPSLASFPLFGVNVQINLLPLGGLTMALPRQPYPSIRLRQWSGRQQVGGDPQHIQINGTPHAAQGCYCGAR